MQSQGCALTPLSSRCGLSVQCARWQGDRGHSTMHPYWVTFSDQKVFSVLRRGVGVTAHNEGDALLLIEEAFGPLMVRQIVVVEDVASLDQGHVRPNMGSLFMRGIWFPLGHERVDGSQVR